VYSLGILMREEGLLEKCDFYATDVNTSALQAGAMGVYPRNAISSSDQLYKDSGGKRSLSHYFDKEGRIDGKIKERVSFMRHNLVTDGSFNEFNVIFCRNVLIYFSKPLQDRVHELLYSSLTHFGILGLGANETVKLTRCEKHYRALDEANKLYRRID
jgi:chemotaxis protein methyltransferase CheR